MVEQQIGESNGFEENSIGTDCGGVIDICG